jgi:hypothetical protein
MIMGFQEKIPLYELVLYTFLEIDIASSSESQEQFRPPEQ